MTGALSSRVTEKTSRDSTSDSFELVGSANIVTGGLEGVFFNEVVNGNGALMLHIGVERPIVSSSTTSHRRDFPGSAVTTASKIQRIPTERRCASSPSTDASVIAAGASARNCSGPSFRIDVRLT